jgi:ribosomal protein S6--L-glutamate ligase
MTIGWNRTGYPIFRQEKCPRLCYAARVMILSFHPIIIGEENINCAGRPPGGEELDALRRASAVILPQGVREDLYRLSRAICPLVWPNYDHRFNFPGKIGQALLFSRLKVPRPRTVIHPSVQDFDRRKAGALPFPYVLKTNADDQGRGIYPVFNRRDMKSAIGDLLQAENEGRIGFVQQERIDHGGRDLRVVVTEDRITAYWRVAKSEDSFMTNLSTGGQPDFESHPEEAEVGRRAVRTFCRNTGINLAGFDVMFDRRADSLQPLFIEINWFFGRRALGGSEQYYRLLKSAVHRWLADHGLKVGSVRSRPRYGQRD